MVTDDANIFDCLRFDSLRREREREREIKRTLSPKRRQMIQFFIYGKLSPCGSFLSSSTAVTLTAVLFIYHLKHLEEQQLRIRRPEQGRQ